MIVMVIVIGFVCCLLSLVDLSLVVYGVLSIAIVIGRLILIDG